MSQVILYPCVTTYMNEAVPDGNYGIVNRFRIGSAAKSGGEYRVLLRIDLSLIGAATIADTSKLELYDTGMGNDAGGISYPMYLVLQTAWTEEGGTWNKYDGVNTWHTGGCSTDDVDYEATDWVVNSVSLGGAGWQEWIGIAPGTLFNELLQEIIDNRGGVADVTIRTNSVANATYSDYESDEGTNNLWPKLTIDYTGGNVPNIATVSSFYPPKPVSWTCVKTIAGQPAADVKVLAGVSEH